MKYEYLAKTLRPVNITALDLGKCSASIAQQIWVRILLDQNVSLKCKWQEDKNNDIIYVALLFWVRSELGLAIRFWSLIFYEAFQQNMEVERKTPRNYESTVFFP